MKKIIIDSTIWISYFLYRGKNNPINEKVSALLEQDITILLPEIIYCEVKNNLRKLGFQDQDFMKMKYFFKRKKKIKIYLGTKCFWFRNVDFYSKKVKLKTQDLIVLTHAFEDGAHDLLTSDKKLLDAYILLKQNS